MSRTVFLTASTLNGFLADSDDSLEWLFAVPGGDSGGEEFERFLDGVGVLVQGSSTYEWVVRHEDLTAHPEKWPAYYGARPTFVFTSRTLPAVPGADVRFVSGPVTDHWETIREAAAGRDVWVVGGGDLAGQFADAGLLDELVVTFAPATLTAGKPLMPRTIGADRLELLEATKRGPFAELRYRVSSA
ncbi:deaminase [Microbacterium mangrovi]|uniref:Deaminase n=1 Tax=Microbacterium mangrovi TaxID=1348253 RepID=A0A0B2A9Y1_9MICO|nr:dihydrofolate reductase family protein [Microbacterium mangrovi]KHK98357.1 deaminase [Microbacterium mangrovi]